MVSEREVKTNVAAAVRKADLNTVSAKQIRRSVEKDLGLERDELAAGKWKALVKTVIEETMAALEQEPTENKQSKEDDSDVENIASKKVRRKKAVIQATPESSPAKSKTPVKFTSPKSPKEVKSNKREAIDLSESPAKKKQKQVPDDQSDSDMSVLNDATPPTTKSRQKSSKEPTRLAKTAAKSKSASKSTTSGPDEEIKHLKSLVFKCGVRKVWSKELPSTMSSSQQISHLKGVLHSLGMTGRLSVEKAKRIKEERELREELDFIQEGARNVGTGGRRRSGI